MTDSPPLKLHGPTTEQRAAAAEGQPEKLLGICQAVGEALGIKPIFLRIALLVLLMFSPIAMIATYAALGGFVVGSWTLFPAPQAKAVDTAEPEQIADDVEERALLAA